MLCSGPLLYSHTAHAQDTGTKKPCYIHSFASYHGIYFISLIFLVISPSSLNFVRVQSLLVLSLEEGKVVYLRVEARPLVATVKS